MTQTNRSLRPHARSSFPRPSGLAVFTTLLMLALLSACNATVGAGSRTTRVGGSVGSTGTMMGIGTSIGPGVAMSTYGDMLHNGPSDIRSNHKKALENLKNGDYNTASAIFGDTLKQYPAHPDATYFLGLTRIYQGQREAGFALLKSYRDPNYYRMTSEVQRMAEYMRNKPDVPPKTVHETMNRYRTDGYNRDVREHKEMMD